VPPPRPAPTPLRPEGWEGWDEYAPFYDWENARTLGRADVPFWTRIAREARGRTLELGCGTGRISIPLARAGVDLVGIDRSGPMLAHAARRAARLRQRRGGRRRGRASLVRGDIRFLPFERGSFDTVLAPYGILQSLLNDADVTATLTAVARVLRRGGVFGIDLVPDVPNWREYTNKIQLRGRAAGGSHLTLIESVHQDRRRKLTIFEQRYVERRNGRAVQHRFNLTFRTLTVRQLTRRLERAGFHVDAVLGDYRGRPWDERADVWIVLARRGRAL
jgi:SAM-dependent methyltransferase